MPSGWYKSKRSPSVATLFPQHTGAFLGDVHTTLYSTIVLLGRKHRAPPQVEVPKYDLVRAVHAHRDAGRLQHDHYYMPRSVRSSRIEHVFGILVDRASQKITWRAAWRLWSRRYHETSPGAAALEFLAIRDELLAASSFNRSEANVRL